jgi:hypothetical protein
MQEQAAPPRFRGFYPHTIEISEELLLKDPFVQQYFRKESVKKAPMLEHIHDTYCGRFPKLLLKIKDPELIDLAGNNYEKFDDIDCINVSCTCSHKPSYLQLFSDTCSDRDSIIYNTCKRCIFAAAKRQIKSAPTPTRAVADDFIKWAEAKIDSLIGDELNDFGYSFNQWYNHLTAAKQKRMDKVHEYLFGDNPLVDHYSSIDKMDPKLLHYEAICKAEIQPIDGKPRMVCAIPDLIKYIMGPVCWKLEELFTHKIPTYCGGMNLQQMQDKINHYIDDGFVIAAEGDGSAFDNTQDVLLKEIDRYIYRKIIDRIYHVPHELFKFVSQMIYKVMDVISTEDKHKKNIMTYAVLGTVFSGDCDTTLMNTLRMGLYNWYTNEKLGFTLGREFICFSKGDDFTVMYQSQVNIDAVKAGYAQYWLGKPKPTGPIYDGCDEREYGLGQILKFIEFGPPSIIKFCSLRAWYTDYHTQHIYLTRDPSKFLTLAKYSRKALHMSNSMLAKYCYEQGLALLVAYPGINYFKRMAEAYFEAGKYYDTGEHELRSARKTRDRRVTLPLEVPEVYDGYSRTPRETTIKIVGSYWQTMKQYVEKDHLQLNSRELELVNQQIDSEFADSPIELLEAWGH